MTDTNTFVVEGELHDHGEGACPSCAGRDMAMSFFAQLQEKIAPVLFPVDEGGRTVFIVSFLAAMAGTLDATLEAGPGLADPANGVREQAKAMSNVILEPITVQ